MLRILTIIGARPQIIKAAAFSRAVSSWNLKHGGDFLIVEKILHTGQHYDTNMSGVFFEELNIPQPDYNLHIGSGTHGYQTAKMIEGIENVLLNNSFDGVVLYGDTNSTLAGAVAASKLNIPIFHIESGLRSFNMTMPEEINRIVCDNLSSIMFSPTKTGVDNLRNSGLIESKAIFKDGKRQVVINCGDVMYDNCVYFSELAAQRSSVLKDNKLSAKNYALVTIHRDNNTDNIERLNAIFKALLKISEQFNQKVVLPLHPRTKKSLYNINSTILENINKSSRFLLLPPASFFDILLLEKNASIVMTDSGGVQKESFFFETPCVILRKETEWVEILESGAGVLADADYNKIIDAYKFLVGKRVTFPKIFGSGNAAELILDEIIKYSI